MPKIIGIRTYCLVCWNVIDVPYAEDEAPAFAKPPCPACEATLREYAFDGTMSSRREPVIGGVRPLRAALRRSLAKDVGAISLDCPRCGNDISLFTGGPTQLERPPCPACEDTMLEGFMMGYGSRDSYEVIG